MTTNVFPQGVQPFSERPQPKTICMFDVDGTLSLARQTAKPETMAALKALRGITATAVVGGSDLPKVVGQLTLEGVDPTGLFDYVFAENGLTAYKLSKPLESASFIKHVGEEEYKKLVNFILRYLSEVDVPIKRGTFIEFRNGMINVSPIGRNASIQERLDFQDFDKVHHVRSTMIKAIKTAFPHLDMTYSIGGQISFDVFPTGWDKTYSLQHIKDEGFTEIHFFGDKTYEGGNDYEIFSDSRTIGHTVTSPEDTVRQLNELFLSK